MCSELWRRHAWVATGTPINAKPQELHGLLAFLGTSPFKDEGAFNALLLNGYKRREPNALYRMRTLLRALCLRRSKQDPAVQAQVLLPPLKWETQLLTFSAEERARYRQAVEVLKRSHRAFSRAQHGRARGSLKARLLGQLNGDLTRVRQTVCHPSVVNASRPRVGAGGRASLIAGFDVGARLPHATVLRRLIARAAVERDAAEAAHLRARVRLHVTQRSIGVAAGVRESMALDSAPFVKQLKALETASAAEVRVETDEVAAEALSGSATRWAKLRAEVRDLLEEDGDEEMMGASSEMQGLAAAVAASPVGMHGLSSKRSKAAKGGSGGGGGGRGSSSSSSTGGDGGKKRKVDAPPASSSYSAPTPATGSGGAGKRRRGASHGEGESDGGDAAARAAADAIISDAEKAVSKAAAAAREKRSTHSYLSSLLPTTAGTAHLSVSSSAGGQAARSAATGGGEEEREEEEEDGGGAGSTEAATTACPICLDEPRPGTLWAVSLCGHSGCHDCLAAALEERSQCVICKKPLTVEGLLPVELAAAADDEAEEAVEELEAVEGEAVEAKGEEARARSSGGNSIGRSSEGGGGDRRRGGKRATSSTTATSSISSAATDAAAAAAVAVAEYGTKVAALVTQLGAVHRSGQKAVVFSAWTRLLALADDALTAHAIPTASLVGSAAAKREALKAFESTATVLLVPLFGGASGAGGGGAAGLTLTQARMAVLLEPALQPGIERQAAGRISRIGQTEATTCLRLIVDETVESKILRWQEVRMADGASASPQLSLNDFAALAE